MTDVLQPQQTPDRVDPVQGSEILIARRLSRAMGQLSARGEEFGGYMPTDPELIDLVIRVTPTELVESTYSVDTVSQFYNQTRGWGLLTKEDEALLGSLIEAGHDAEAQIDKAASVAEQEELEWARAEGRFAHRVFFHTNLRLVSKIASQFSQKVEGSELKLLLRAGLEGLDHAINKFDYKKNFKFSTYGSWWIKQAIMRSMNTGGPIHVPDSVMSDAIRINENDSEELDEVMQAALAALNPLSFDMPIGESGNLTLDDVLEDKKADPEMQALQGISIDRLYEAMSKLDVRERRAVAWYFGLDGGMELTHQKIGDYTGGTRETARRRVGVALTKLRAILNVEPDELEAS